MADVTQSGYDHHLVRVAAEHGARASIAAIEAARQDAEPVVWMIGNRVTRTPFWGFMQNHYRSKEEAEKAAKCLKDYEPFPLFAHPSPDLVNVLVEALQRIERYAGSDALIGDTARQALALVGEGEADGPVHHTPA